MQRGQQLWEKRVVDEWEERGEKEKILKGWMN